MRIFDRFIQLKCKGIRCIQQHEIFNIDYFQHEDFKSYVHL